MDTGERQGKGHDAEQRDCPDIFQQGKPDLRSVVPYDPDTAVIPNLLVGGVVDAIMDSGALKVYVCNVMTQAGETEGYTAADHIRALFDHAWPGLFDICLTSDSPIPRSIAERYLAEGAEPLLCDREA